MSWIAFYSVQAFLVLSFLIKFLNVLVTGVAVMNIEKQTGFLRQFFIFFVTKRGWKPVLTAVSTEVNEVLSYGSILEVKALRGFLHSKLILNQSVSMKKESSKTRKLKTFCLNIERQMLLHRSSLLCTASV